MQCTDIPALTEEINGCHVTLSFLPEPAEDVVEKVKSILSNAYDERVKNDLMKLSARKYNENGKLSGYHYKYPDIVF